MLYDISVVTSAATAEWPGDTPFSCGWTLTLDGGASVNLSSVTMSPHVGTHADSPLHVRDGAPASHELPLDVFMGRARVCSASARTGELSLDDLATLPAEGTVERLLLRTGCSIALGGFPDDWPTLAPSSVRALLGRGLRLLGVDVPSVDCRSSKPLPVHHTLFDGGAYNLENLDLARVPDGEYDLIALPMRLLGLDAAPVRAVLRAIG